MSVKKCTITPQQSADAKNKLNELQLAMYRTLNEKQFPENAIDLAFKYLENPLVIMDHNYHLLAYRKGTAVFPTPWQTLVNNRMLNSSCMDDDYFYTGQLKSLHTREPIPFKIEEYNDYVCSMIHNDIFLGSVSLLECNRTVTEYDLDVLKTLADVIGIHLSQTSLYPNDIEFQYERILVDLLNGRINDKNDLAFLMHTRKWEQNFQNQIFLFHPQKQDERMLRHIKNNFESLYPNVKNILFNNHILILNETSKTYNSEIPFSDFCHRYNIRTGISGIFENLLDIRIYYEQAKCALYHGLRKHPSAYSYFYYDYIMEDIAEHLHTIGSVRHFCHPAVLQLFNYDKKHHSNFSETFYTYIEQNRSISKTSQILHQHKNTVNYRIQRIKEMFEIDLTDFNELTHIYLTFKLLLAQDSTSSDI